MCRTRDSFFFAIFAIFAFCLFAAFPSAQRGTGELHIVVRDATGAALRATGRIASDATRVDRTFETDAAGVFVATGLPFGMYRLHVEAPGFAAAGLTIDVRSEVPMRAPVTLNLSPIAANVDVAAVSTLLDPYRPGSVSFVGGDLLRARPAAPPGRSIVDLVGTLPGWLETSNGVLHPRGAEYQVQYVVDGIPLRDNRSPAFAQSLGIDEFESLTARTSGFPAEFGGKLGGVIEVATARDRRQGLHGVADLQAGSFAVRSGFASAQYGAGGTSVGASAEGMSTDRYLDPPVLDNFSNHGSGRGVAARVERQWRDGDRTRAYVHRRATDFFVPNDPLQERAGQRQRRASAETLVQASHQHVFSGDVLASGAVMARRTAATLASNDASTPIRPQQDRGFTDLYASGSVAVHRGRHEIKVGGESTRGTVRESFSSTITAYAVDGVPVFDEHVPGSFAFADRRPLREQAAYAQDLVRLGRATISAGLRFDRYRLAVSEHALSPRVSASYYVEPARLVLHASYDRAFETPPIENVLLASSDLIPRLGGAGTSLSLKSSRGHFVEAGAARELFGRARVDLNAYRRSIANFFDDDLLLNTAVSFPFTFSHAVISGVEAGVDVRQWRRLSGGLHYGYSVGTGMLPITGGLFIGDEAADLLASVDHFPTSEDQRHTLRARVRFDVAPRVTLSAAGRVDSGLPIEIDGEVDQDALARQFGRAVVGRVDFARGRVRLSSSLDSSFAVLAWKGRDARQSLRLQVDGFNLTNRLNVINFASLLSETAIGAGRSWAVRLRAEF
jgi:carboxypeptidase family protein